MGILTLICSIMIEPLFCCILLQKFVMCIVHIDITNYKCKYLILIAIIYFHQSETVYSIHPSFNDERNMALPNSIQSFNKNSYYLLFTYDY